MLNRVRELTVQAANDTNNDTDRIKIAGEVAQLLGEIDAISERTEFNGKKLTAGPDAQNAAKNFNGSFQIGANKGQSLDLTIDAMSVDKIGIAVAANAGVGNAGADTLSKAFAITKDVAGTPGYIVVDASISKTSAAYSNALGEVDAALEKVNVQRSKLGANQNRLEYTINNLDLSSENLSSAKSRIEDADMAKEMMNLTSANVLQQAATSMLAQANQAPNSITQLLG